MKKLLILIILGCSVFGTLSAKQTYPRAVKLISGAYTHEDSEKGKKPWTMKHAGNFDEKDGLAPVSFDGKHYAYMDAYGCVVTPLVFPSMPSSRYKGVCLVKAGEDSCYLYSLSGRVLCPPQKKMSFDHGIIILTNSNGKQQFVNGEFSPINDSQYAYIINPHISFNINDSIYEPKLTVGTIKYNDDRYLDMDGNPIFPNLSMVSPILRHSSYYHIDEALKKNKLNCKSLSEMVYTGSPDGGKTYGVYLLTGRELVAPKAKNPEKAAKTFLKQIKKSFIPLWNHGKIQEELIGFVERLDVTAQQRADSNLKSLDVDSEWDVSKLEPQFYFIEIQDTIVSPNSTSSAKGKKKSRKKTVKPKAKHLKYLANNSGASTLFSSQLFEEVIEPFIFPICRKEGSTKYNLYNVYGMPMTEEGFDEISFWHYTTDKEPVFKVRQGNKWYIINSVGTRMSPDEYDEIKYWHSVGDKVFNLVRQGSEWGVVDQIGIEVLAPQYSEISSTNKDFAVATRDGLQYLVSASTGCLVNNVPYDKISDYSDKEGMRRVERMGYTTKVDKNGKESPTIASIVFGEVYDKIQTEELSDAEKIEEYANCLEFCGSDDNLIRGYIYNNVGVIFDNAGDIDHAKEYFQYAARYNNPTAKDNLDNIKKRERAQRWQAVAGTLGSLAQGLSQAAGNNGGFAAGLASGLSGETAGSIGNFNFSPDNSCSYTDSSTYSGNSSGGKYASESYYRDTYRKWEERAKDLYESLTRQGSRTKKNGEYTSGTANGNWGHHYIGLKSNLRDAQSNMRKIRQEARRAGYTIAQSNYETVIVTN